MAEVLEATPASGSAPSGDLSGASGFRAVVAPFAQRAADRLPDTAAAAGVDLPTVLSRFVDRTVGALVRQAARTLVLELNVARVTGKLSGGTPEERFRDFAARAASRDGLTALVHEYPVLARLLARTSMDAADALTELLGRFARDRADLVACLLAGVDPGPLIAVHQGIGDGHRRGRSVAVLEFATGARVVYKPRPLQAHQHFNELVGWFNARLDTPDLRTVALLERPGYGWSEFVTARPCVNHGQVEAFYRKQGAWLALLHFLHGTDLHYENLIAHAEDPVLVDIETLFHPYAPDEEDEDPAVLALRSSVFGVGLLPHLLVGDETVLDVSGLGGDKAVALPTPGVEWADAGTDTMRLVRRARQFTGAENRPRIHGADADADPAVHTEALLAGFRVGYRTVVAGRGELLGQDGLLRRFADDEIRVVARATAGYATLLDESTHPDALRDAEERESVLRQLDTDAFGHPGWPGLADEEIAELWDGDVPMFTTRPGSTDLWSGTGRRIPGALERPGLLRVEERLRAMGQADLAAQEWIVRAAMASRSTSPAHRVGDPLPDAPGHAAEGSAAETPGQDRARLLAAARGIGDRLVESAHQGPQKANWLGLELLADRYWRLAPCGADLGGGFPGPALFLAQLFALTGTARYAETARRALRPLPRLLDRLARHPENLAEVGSGAFAGLGGIAYALAQVAELLDDSDIRDLVEPATALTVHAVEAEEAPGVADGTAGGVAALLAVHRLTGSATAWHGARTGATRLVDSPPPAAPGFAAGAAGVGWALLTYAAAGGGTACERAGLEVLRAAARSATGRSWCEGLPGVALAVADSAAATADPELARFAANAVEAVAAVGALPDHSLCHGELGALEALSAPVSAVGSARGAVRGRQDALVAALARSGPHCGTPSALPVPGLLTGLAGIGHGILRLGFPERTPSVLLLQPPTGGGPSHRAPQPHRMESHRGRR